MPFQAKFSHVFDHTWDRVTQAFWLKYQSPRMAHIKEVIVLSRSVDDAGRLSTRRLVVAQLKVPAILASFVARRIDSWYAIEDTVMDAKARQLQVTMRNVSYGRVVEAVQSSSYQPGPDGDATTLLETTVNIKCASTVPWFIRSRAESVMGKEQSKSYSNTLSILEELCAALRTDASYKPSRPPPPPATASSHGAMDVHVA